MNYRIPFNRPCFAGAEQQHIIEALASGKISGDGLFSRKCHELLERELGAAKVLLTTSCTHALEMAALLLRLEPGQEVVVPSFTFVSSVNAFILRGARPVFADIRPDTLNLDENALEGLLTPATKAVVAVHYAGVGCEMDRILELTAPIGAALVEDNAHGLFGSYKGRPLGSFGALATQSFHETKNFTCGEGGALVVNDPELAARAEIIREKGTNRSSFFRGEVDKYTWVDLGSSYLPSEVLAAFLYAQLEQRERIQAKRRAIWERYRDGLAGWADSSGVRLPVVPEHCGQSYHMFHMLMPSLESRQRIIAELKAKSILAVFHYVPLHLSPMGRGFGGRPGQCPVAEDLSDRLLRLPFYNDLDEASQDEVIEAVASFTP
ncbi:dTDP-4-amino-4,6-dideoxygalactose transaminase [Fundidesulfovibrio agrisoli]|uniref:dTDP-4-amino-4,6-dideoxygalactose transaminase n=1 Tax=Fundidesulfovibrio agrisoli TaxID=2922717 RepID=UPI001FAE71DD|nr:dTDP-4-amino-4,6-dideoxygalactose transaminase [Fundidesulfovibrio agrisoli]